MLRPSRPLLLAALLLVALVVVRQVGATRAPKRRLDVGGPIVGSLDTWPPVPRAPGR